MSHTAGRAVVLGPLTLHSFACLSCLFFLLDCRWLCRQPGCWGMAGVQSSSRCLTDLHMLASPCCCMLWSRCPCYPARSLNWHLLHAIFMGVQVWAPMHDKALLVGVLRHGYGNWGLIVRDATLGLLPVLQVEVQVVIDPEAVVALQRLHPNAVLSFGNTDGDDGGGGGAAPLQTGRTANGMHARECFLLPNFWLPNFLPGFWWKGCMSSGAGALCVCVCARVCACVLVRVWCSCVRVHALATHMLIDANQHNGIHKYRPSAAYRWHLGGQWCAWW